MKKFIITNDQAQMLLNYLVTRPYNEVHLAINEIRFNMPPLPELEAAPSAPPKKEEAKTAHIDLKKESKKKQKAEKADLKAV